MRSQLPVAVSALIAAAAVALPLRAQTPDRSVDLPATLARIGEHVAQYYERARSILCIETVVIQPLTSTFAFDGPSRELKYELRVEWDPALAGEGPPEAKIIRQLLTVGGRPPRPKDEPECTDPKPVSPEPLAMLLPGRRDDYTFKWVGTSRNDGRPSVVLDYRSAGPKPDTVVWKGDCVSIEMPGRSEGRLWIDAATDDVVRVDEHLIGMFEFRVPREHSLGGRVSWMAVERADSSIRYRLVTFRDPDETMTLPASVVLTTAVRSGRVARLRTTQTFSHYKRFVTGGRVVGEDE